MKEKKAGRWKKKTYPNVESTGWLARIKGAASSMDEDNAGGGGGM